MSIEIKQELNQLGYSFESEGGESTCDKIFFNYRGWIDRY